MAMFATHSTAAGEEPQQRQSANSGLCPYRIAWREAVIRNLR
jgi:hypothetical protein